MPVHIGALAKPLLVAPERHPLRPAAAAAALGRTIVFAPHPDDESLGCGGLLALLGNAGIDATVVMMTDGSLSHPNSVTHSRARLAATREDETLAAIGALGLPSSAVNFLRYRDCALPAPGTAGFSAAAAGVTTLVDAIAPETILVPWRRDPHCDHVSTWHVVREAVAHAGNIPRWLEYPVWAWSDAEGDAGPRDDEAVAWRLDISSVLEQKQDAIAQHRSQLGQLIRDDPDGFVLRPEVLTYFAQPWELFLVPYDV